MGRLYSPYKTGTSYPAAMAIGHNLQPVAQMNRRAVGDRDVAVFFGETFENIFGVVLYVAVIFLFAGKQRVGGKGLAARVDDGAASHAGADDGGQDCGRAIRVGDGFGIDRIAVVEDVGAGTNLRHAVKLVTQVSGGRVPSADQRVWDSGHVQ